MKSETKLFLILFESEQMGFKNALKSYFALGMIKRINICNCNIGLLKIQ